jgi:hypothetical protein
MGATQVHAYARGRTNEIWQHACRTTNAITQPMQYVADRPAAGGLDRVMFVPL